MRALPSILHLEYHPVRGFTAADCPEDPRQHADLARAKAYVAGLRDEIAADHPCYLGAPTVDPRDYITGLAGMPCGCRSARPED